MRVFGAFFLLLAAVGRLSGPFPYSAGWGDVIVGLTAIPLAMRSPAARPARTIFAWNVFGALDLVAAVTLGTLSSEGFVTQIFTGVQARPLCSICRGCSSRPRWCRSI